MTQPASLFISHGAPDLALHDTAARKFLQSAGSSIGKPKGIIIASAHFETAHPTIVSDETPEMIYDFGGFDPRLRQFIYPAIGSGDLAARVSELLSMANIENNTLAKRGFDHGAWVPLSLLYPEADIPVVQLSVQPALTPAHHYDMGVALQPLVAEGVLVIGSGAITHNLSELFSPSGIRHQRNDEELEWARLFADWIGERISKGANESLKNYRAEAPFAVENHPTEEHLLPLFVALGASAKGTGERLHKSTQYAILAMDAFAFH